MKYLFGFLFFLTCAKKTEPQIVPVGQLFVGDDVKAGCTVQLKSENVLRVIRGCYRAKMQFIEGCHLVKYYREVEQCCSSSYAEFLRWSSGLTFQPCYQVQQYFINYCVKVPNYGLHEGCSKMEPCGEKADIQTTPQDLQSIKLTSDTNEECPKMKFRRYKGRILAGCRRIESSAKPQLHCIRIKRNLPFKSCCASENLRVKFIPGLKMCKQYVQTESEYCFSAPSESLSSCNERVTKECGSN